MTIAPTPHHQADPESQLAEPAPQRRVETVQGPAGPIEVHVTGAGQAVVLLPSLGRGAEDFEAAPADRRAAIQTAFFAPGNDASVWHDGWHGIVAYFQGQATTNQPVEHWWAAGAADVLVVQPADDVIAVAENARLIVEQLGTRASLVTIRHAGHALLPEQPEKVADAILSWLANRSVGR